MYIHSFLLFTLEFWGYCTVVGTPDFKDDSKEKLILTHIILENWAVDNIILETRSVNFGILTSLVSFYHLTPLKADYIEKQNL